MKLFAFFQFYGCRASKGDATPEQRNAFCNKSLAEHLERDLYVFSCVASNTPKRCLAKAKKLSDE